MSVQALLARMVGLARIYMARINVRTLFRVCFLRNAISTWGLIQGTCPSGFSGANCENNLNMCASNPCDSVSTLSCVNLENGFQCKCVDGYTGEFCDQIVDPCLSNPCRQGVCISLLGSYTCDCYSEFTGATCDTWLMACESNPCMNGATCLDYHSFYRCLCDSSYEGVNCENRKDFCALGFCGPNAEMTNILFQEFGRRIHVHLQMQAGMDRWLLQPERELLLV